MMQLIDDAHLIHIELLDYGTLDTIIRFNCPDCGAEVTWTYDACSELRDEHGVLNLDAMREMISAVSIPVIASGGVSSRDDLQALAGIGVEGAIVGKALYTGALPPEVIREFD